MIELSKLEGFLETLYAYFVPPLLFLVLVGLSNSYIFTFNGPNLSGSLADDTAKVGEPIPSICEDPMIIHTHEGHIALDPCSGALFSVNQEDFIDNIYKLLVDNDQKIERLEGALKSIGFSISADDFGSFIQTFLISFVLLVLFFGIVLKLLYPLMPIQFVGADEISFLEYCERKFYRKQQSWMLLRQEALNRPEMAEVKSLIKKLYKSGEHMAACGYSVQIALCVFLISIVGLYPGHVESKYQGLYGVAAISGAIILYGFLIMLFSRMYHHRIYRAMGLTQRAMVAHRNEVFPFKNYRRVPKLPKNIQATHIIRLPPANPWRKPDIAQWKRRRARANGEKICVYWFKCAVLPIRNALSLLLRPLWPACPT